MRAAIMRKAGEPLEITEIDRPTAGPEDVVIDIEACGICRSDWHGWMGGADWDLEGQILGHEPAGTVVEVGEDVDSFSEGDRVAVAYNIGDGNCHRCLSGHSHECENRRVLGFSPDVPGAWAEEMAVPKADVNAVHLPEGVSPTEMAGLGCRFITAFQALENRADIHAGDWTVVHGCGGVGLSAVNVASALGANVIAVDIESEKLDMATGLGADVTVNARDTEDVPSEIHGITDGGAEISVDALGIQETYRNSLESLDTFGQHVQLGVTEGEGDTPDLPINDIVRKQLTLIGSRGMPAVEFDKIFQMMEYDRISPEKLITRHVSIEEISSRLEAMTNYETKGIEVITEF